MKFTFRYYGRGADPIPLEYIRQIPGVSGIMGVIGDYGPGGLWEEERIRAYVEGIHAAGLEVEVIESVKVHEAIKLGIPERELYIENYIGTVRNLAKYGVKVIVYDFMPIFDWVRTDLAHVLEDGSTTMYYDGAWLQELKNPADLVAHMLGGSGGFTLAGWEPERFSDLERMFRQYEGIDEARLLENLGYFLSRVIPVCEEAGLTMALHPDDPAWPIFGVPRIAHTEEQLERILALNSSPKHSLCLCTGSLGSHPENDIPAMIRRFGEKGRIACAHVRNVRQLGPWKFAESAHPTSEGNLDMAEIMKALYETGFDGYIRPDHGRMIWGEAGRPGYGLYDRALGIAYLTGLWEMLEKTGGRKQAASLPG